MMPMVLKRNSAEKSLGGIEIRQTPTKRDKIGPLESVQKTAEIKKNVVIKNLLLRCS